LPTAKSRRTAAPILRLEVEGRLKFREHIGQNRLPDCYRCDVTRNVPRKLPPIRFAYKQLEICYVKLSSDN